MICSVLINDVQECVLNNELLSTFSFERMNVKSLEKKLSLETNFWRLNLPWLRYHNAWALIRNPQIRRVTISTPIHARTSLPLEPSGTSCMQSRNFLYCVTASRGLQIPFVPNLFLDFRRMALVICFATMVIGKKVANAFQRVSIGPPWYISFWERLGSFIKRVQTLILFLLKLFLQ